jgi:hypothetical protein
MNRFVLAATVSACLVVTGPTAGADHTADSLDTVTKALADGKAVLIDVREDSEWAGGHLKDARHLALVIGTETRNAIGSESGSAPVAR